MQFATHTLDVTLQRDGACPGLVLMMEGPGRAHHFPLGAASNFSDLPEQQAILETIRERKRTTPWYGLAFIGTRMTRSTHEGSTVFVWVYGLQGKVHRKWFLDSTDQVQRGRVIEGPEIAFCFLDAVTPCPPYSCSLCEPSLFMQRLIRRELVDRDALVDYPGMLRRPILFCATDEDHDRRSEPTFEWFH